ncbi:hypothetical protein RQP46_007617 [Phenoliferia psychrophenolica]
MSKDFTLEELKALKGKSDLHLLIHGKVYAIAKFCDEHPGGDDVLFSEAGRDGTEAFEDVGHSDEAREILDKYLVGTCSEVPSKAEAKTRGVGSANTGQTYTYLVPIIGVALYIGYQYYTKN